MGDVPDADLDEVFRRAIRANTTEFMVTSGAAVQAWQDLKADKLLARQARGADPAAGVGGYLPDGSPAPLFNLAPLMAELDYWARVLYEPPPMTEPDPLAQQRAAFKQRSARIQQALNVKRHYRLGVPDCVLFVREIGAALKEARPTATFADLLAEVHGDVEQPADPRGVPPLPCRRCKGAGWLVLERGSTELVACPECRR